MILDKNMLVLYPGGYGYGGGYTYVRPPIAEPRPVPLYGVVRPLYSVSIE